MKINSAEKLQEAQKVIDYLLNKNNLSQQEMELLDSLSTDIYNYEESQNIIPDIYGIELLKVLMVEKEISTKDLLEVFETEAIATDILSDRRQLSVEDIEKLANFFNVPAAVFFPKNT